MGHASGDEKSMLMSPWVVGTLVGRCRLALGSIKPRVESASGFSA
jgi:hypothetical protein